MNDQLHAALNQQYGHLQEQADAERRQRRRAEWPEARADLVRRWHEAKRQHEERGEPFVMGELPGLDAPEWYMQADPSPRVLVDVPQVPQAGIGAPGFDWQGRYVGPAVETRTAEQQFDDAGKASRGLRAVLSR